MLRTCLCLLTLGATLAAVPSAHAAGWVTSEPLSPANRLASEPQVLLLPDGGRVVAWIQIGADAQTRENVSVRIAPPGGDFGPTQVITAQPGELQLSAGADGTVALAWTDSVTRTVHVARRAPGAATFTAVPAVRPPVDEFPFGIDLTVDRGDVYLAYTSSAQGRSSSISAARLPAAGTAIQHIQGDPLVHLVSASAFLRDAGLAVSGDRVSVVWSRTVSRQPPAQSEATVFTASGTIAGFGAARTLDTQFDNSPFPPSTTPRIVSGGGRTYVVWQRERERVLVSEDTANPGRILTFGGDPLSFRFDVAVDGSGALVAAWEGPPPGVNEKSISAARIPAGGAPQAPVRLTPVGVSRIFNSLALASDGSALIAVDHGSGSFTSTRDIEAALQPAGGAFGPIEGVSGLQDVVLNRSSLASAAVAPGGGAVIAWSAADHSGTINERLFVSQRDVTPPAFARIDVPQAATVGQPVGLAAGATDALSGAQVTWDFGDGSEGSGDEVSHVYGRAGAATVTVTATDSVGNTTTQTRVIAVAPAARAAAPGGGPGPAVDAPDRVRPVVGRVSVTNRRFRVGSRATTRLAGRSRAPVGTALRLTLSERSTLAIAISSKAKKKTVVHGTLVRARSGPGNVTIAFSGRLGRTALRPGTYTATVTAIDGSGNRSSAARVKFTVVKR